MAARNVLVVALEEAPEEEIREAVRRRAAGDDVTVHVVAPAGDVGVLQWLTAPAAHAVDALEGETETEVEVGDHDPLVAVQDALALFPADEILVAGTGAAEVEAGLRRFDLPVARLDTASPDGGANGEAPAAAAARTLARGRAPGTPLLLLGVVGLFLLCAIALISLITFLVFWLV